MNLETKLFSETVQDDFFRMAIKATSRSKQDAKMREETYGQVFKNYNEMQNTYTKMFSGYSENPILANQYYNATVAAFLSSFAPYLAVETSLDAPVQVVSFFDVLGVSDGRTIIPNIGVENRAGMLARMSGTIAIATGTATYDVSTGKKIIPGSVKVTLVKNGTTPVIEFVDDRKGNIIGPAGYLAKGAVNYSTGLIEFDPLQGGNWTAATGDVVKYTASEDTSGVPDLAGGATPSYANRVKLGLTNMLMQSVPDMIIGESNLLGIAAMQKAIKSDPAAFLDSKITELYVKLINDLMVSKIQGEYTGTTAAIETRQAQTGYQDYTSQINRFIGELTEVDKLLAYKSSKGLRATSYLVGGDVAAMFEKTSITGNWVPNTTATFVSDLIGYFKGIPVLRHTDIADNTGFAVHKTVGGEIAPLMRSIFLPLTNMPAVGNYNNPSQYANGVYYQEVDEMITDKLLQKFTLAQD